MDTPDAIPVMQPETRRSSPPSSPVSSALALRPVLNRSLTHEPHLFASLTENIGISSSCSRVGVSLREELPRHQQQERQQVQALHQRQQSFGSASGNASSSASIHVDCKIANIESNPSTGNKGQGPAPPYITQAQDALRQGLRSHGISNHTPASTSSPLKPTPTSASIAAVSPSAAPALRPPYSTRPNQTVSSLASPSLAASAFAAIHKVYSSMDDVGFWTSLYNQHHIHTRQSHDSDNGSAIKNENGYDSSKSQGIIDKHSTNIHGLVKVWQALTKTPLNNPSQPFRFERLPIKVPMSTAASSSSPSGQPFTIVFFFTVESAPATLWFLESAFTNSRTLNEYMELMGIFDPNEPNDPSSFYIYETQPLILTVPTYEDTMLDIHVQSPTGSIYAAYSYTFVKTTALSSQSSAHATPVSVLSSNTMTPSIDQASLLQRSPDAIDSSVKAKVSTVSKDRQPKILPTIDPFEGMDEEEVLAAIGHDVLEDDVVDDNVDDDGIGANIGPQECAGETLSEEPDAGEHFMQATSEFFSKMGYWLYNSRVVQYIAREDRNRTKTIFPTDDIWILGVRYSFNEGEHASVPPEPPRSRKTSIFTSLDIGSKTRRVSNLLGPTAYPTPRSSVNNALPFSSNGPEGNTSSDTFKLESSTKTSRRSSRQPLTPSINSSLQPDHTGNFKTAKSQERRIEKEVVKEQSRARKQAKAQEKDQEKERKAAAKAIEREAHERERELYKDQKLERQRQRQREKDLEKERRQQMRHDKEIQRALHIHGDGQYHSAPLPLPALPGTSTSHHSPTLPPEPPRRRLQRNLPRGSHPPAIESVDPIEKHSQPGMEGREGEKGAGSVMRRMRSMSILRKVPSAVDLLAFRKSPEPTEVGFVPERTHQPRSRSISNLTSFSPRSAISSTTSSQADHQPHPSFPLHSPGNSMSFHEAPDMVPKTSMLTRLSQLNLGSKKLPELPRSVDDMTDLSTYPALTWGKKDGIPAAPTSSGPTVDITVNDTTSPGSPHRTNRRRMTISGIFSRESSGDTSSGLVNIKSLLGSGKGGNKPKSHLRPEHDQLPPLSPGGPRSSTGVGGAGCIPQTSTSSSISASSTSSCHSKRGNISKWIEKRASSNNLIFIASTEEPVPSLSKETTNSFSAQQPPLPRIHSPLSTTFTNTTTVVGGHAVYNLSQENTPNSSPHSLPRRRKKGSISLTSSPGSSPKSALKHPGSPSPLNSPLFAGTSLNGLGTSAKLNDADFGPLFPLSKERTLGLVSPTPQSTRIHSTLNLSLSPHTIEPNNALGILAPAAPLSHNNSYSPAGKTELPLLPPESSTEAFVLLDPDGHPNNGGTPRMGHDSMIHMEDSRLSLELLYDDARQDPPSPMSNVEISSQRLEVLRQQQDSPPFARTHKSSISRPLDIHVDRDVSDLRSDWEALWPSNTHQTPKEPLTLDTTLDAAGFVHVQESECKPPEVQNEKNPQKHQSMSDSKVMSSKDGNDDNDDKEVLVEKEDVSESTTEAIVEGDEETILIAPQHCITIGSNGQSHLSTLVGTANSNEETIRRFLQQEVPKRDPVRSSTIPSPSSPSPSLTRSFSFLSQQTLSRSRSSTSVTSATAAMSGPSHPAIKNASMTALQLTEEPRELDIQSLRESSTEDKQEAVLQQQHQTPRHHHQQHQQRQLRNTHPKADMTFIPPSSAAYLSSFKAGPLEKLSHNQVVLVNFMLDFQSKIWFTYRKDIPRIEPSFYTSDAGWGCMMRTGQSLLAQGFVQALLGRTWRPTTPQSESAKSVYKMILSWFVDEPERPYSIQNIAKCGLVLDKRIGEWFGPSTVAHALLRLSQRHIDCPLALIVSMDGLVHTSEIIQAATGTTSPLPSSGSSSASNSVKSNYDHVSPQSSSTSWKPVVLLMPMRFGLQKLKEQYISNLKRLFQLPQFLGIAGGRPGRSLYFVASQGNELFYLDPHVVKPRVSSDEMNTFPIASFHCTVVRSIDIQEIDPSMLLGFVIKSQGDLEDLRARYEELMDRAYTLMTFVQDTPFLSSLLTGGTNCQGDQRGQLRQGEQLQSPSHESNVIFQESRQTSNKEPAPSSSAELSCSRPVDLYEYRYSSHHGNHTHNQDTLSVHSLDSDEE